MTLHAITTLTGSVTHLFGHRFVVQTATGAVLADLGPDVADAVTLAIGDRVDLQGDQKPTELKVTSIAVGGQTATIRHKPKAKPDDTAHDDADPRAAIAAAEAAGYRVAGEPRRRPKHFELSGMKDGGVAELHIALDGTIRKVKPAARHPGHDAGAPHPAR